MCIQLNLFEEQKSTESKITYVPFECDVALEEAAVDGGTGSESFAGAEQRIKRATRTVGAKPLAFGDLEQWGGHAGQMSRQVASVAQHQRRGIVGALADLAGQIFAITVAVVVITVARYGGSRR